MSVLLIGNGINQLTEDKQFSNVNIAKRFKSVLSLNSEVITNMFMTTAEKQEERIDHYTNSCCDETDNIEMLAGKVYKFIKNSNLRFSDNNRGRLIDILTVISIQTIFVNVDGLVAYANISRNKVNILKRHRKIFTLNYYEKWDKKGVCEYLHGKFNSVNLILEHKKPLFISSVLYKYNEAYRKSINALPKEYKRISLLKSQLNPIIFMPEISKYSKQDHYGNGLMCSENLYPADDLFPSTGLGDIYSKLRMLDCIDIFGVSPFGDESLLKALSVVPNVTVYIYKMDECVDEINKWREYIKVCTFKDSEEFWLR